jgi:hypothetical protein
LRTCCSSQRSPSKCPCPASFSQKAESPQLGSVSELVVEWKGTCQCEYRSRTLVTPGAHLPWLPAPELPRKLTPVEIPKGSVMPCAHGSVLPSPVR